MSFTRGEAGRPPASDPEGAQLFNHSFTPISAGGRPLQQPSRSNNVATTAGHANGESRPLSQYHGYNNNNNSSNTMYVNQVQTQSRSSMRSTNNNTITTTATTTSNNFSITRGGVGSGMFRGIGGVSESEEESNDEDEDDDNDQENTGVRRHTPSNERGLLNNTTSNTSSRRHGNKAKKVSLAETKSGGANANSQPSSLLLGNQSFVGTMVGGSQLMVSSVRDALFKNVKIVSPWRLRLRRKLFPYAVKSKRPSSKKRKGKSRGEEGGTNEQEQDGGTDGEEVKGSKKQQMSEKGDDGNNNSNNNNKKVTRRGLFDWAMTFVNVLVIAVSAAHDYTDAQCHEQRCHVLMGLDAAITAVFLAETALHMMAFGARKYLHPLRALDLIILTTNAILFAVYLNGQISVWPSLLVLRVMRIFRPMITTTRFPQLRVLIVALLKSLFQLTDVVLLFLILLLWFAVAGANQMSGTLRKACIHKSYFYGDAITGPWPTYHTYDNSSSNSQPRGRGSSAVGTYSWEDLTIGEDLLRGPPSDDDDNGDNKQNSSSRRYPNYYDIYRWNWLHNDFEDKNNNDGTNNGSGGGDGGGSSSSTQEASSTTATTSSTAAVEYSTTTTDVTTAPAFSNLTTTNESVTQETHTGNNGKNFKLNDSIANATAYPPPAAWWPLYFKERTFDSFRCGFFDVWHATFLRFNNTLTACIDEDRGKQQQQASTDSSGSNFTAVKECLYEQYFFINSTAYAHIYADMEWHQKRNNNSSSTNQTADSNPLFPRFIKNPNATELIPYELLRLAEGNFDFAFSSPHHSPDACSPYQTCTIEGKSLMSGYVCPTDYLCVDSPHATFFFGYVGFDGVLPSALTVFISVSFQLWYQVMYMAYDVDSFLVYLFFVALVVIGGILVTQLTTVIITVEFEKAQEEENRRVLAIKAENTAVLDSFASVVQRLVRLTRIAKQAEEEQQALRMAAASAESESEDARRQGSGIDLDLIAQLQQQQNQMLFSPSSSEGGGSEGHLSTNRNMLGPQRPEPISARIKSQEARAKQGENNDKMLLLLSKVADKLLEAYLKLQKARHWVNFNIVATAPFEYASLLVILINTVLMCLEREGMPEGEINVYTELGYFFVSFWTLEFLLRLFAAPDVSAYLSLSMTWLDAMVAGVMWIDVFLSATQYRIPFLGVVRSVKVFKLLTLFPKLYVWLQLILTALVTAPMALFVFFFTAIIFACLFLNTLGGQLCGTELEGTNTFDFGGLVVNPNYLHATAEDKSNFDFDPISGAYYPRDYWSDPSRYRKYATNDENNKTSSVFGGGESGASRGDDQPLVLASTTSAPAPSGKTSINFAGLVDNTRFCEGLPKANFDGFWMAFVTSFQIATGDDWELVMYTAMRSKGVGMVIPFCLYFYLTAYMLLPLLVGIVLTAKDESGQSDEGHANRPQQTEAAHSGDLTSEENGRGGGEGQGGGDTDFGTMVDRGAGVASSVRMANSVNSPRDHGDFRGGGDGEEEEMAPHFSSSPLSPSSTLRGDMSVAERLRVRSRERALAHRQGHHVQIGSPTTTATVVGGAQASSSSSIAAGGKVGADPLSDEHDHMNHPQHLGHHHQQEQRKQGGGGVMRKERKVRAKDEADDGMRLDPPSKRVAFVIEPDGTKRADIKVKHLVYNTPTISSTDGKNSCGRRSRGNSFFSSFSSQVSTSADSHHISRTNSTDKNNANNNNNNNKIPLVARILEEKRLRRQIANQRMRTELRNQSRNRVLGQLPTALLLGTEAASSEAAAAALAGANYDVARARSSGANGVGEDGGGRRFGQGSLSSSSVFASQQQTRRPPSRSSASTQKSIALQLNELWLTSSSSSDGDDEGEEGDDILDYPRDPPLFGNANVHNKNNVNISMTSSSDTIASIMDRDLREQHNQQQRHHSTFSDVIVDGNIRGQLSSSMQRPLLLGDETTRTEALAIPHISSPQHANNQEMFVHGFDHTFGLVDGVRGTRPPGEGSSSAPLSPYRPPPPVPMAAEGHDAHDEGGEEMTPTRLISGAGGEHSGSSVTGEDDQHSGPSETFDKSQQACSSNINTTDSTQNQKEEIDRIQQQKEEEKKEAFLSRCFAQIPTRRQARKFVRRRQRKFLAQCDALGDKIRTFAVSYFSYWMVFSRICHRLSQQTLYRLFMAVMMVYGTVVLCLKDILAAPDSQRQRNLNMMETVFVAINVLDVFFVRAIGMGLFLNKGAIILRAGTWENADVFLALVSLLSLIIDTQPGFATDGWFSEILRIIRAVRPFMALQYLPGCALITSTLASSVTQLRRVTAVTGMAMFVLAIEGVRQFRGLLRICFVPREGFDVTLGRVECEAIGGTWTNDGAHFDHLASALQAVFSISTLEGWADIMHRLMDAAPDSNLARQRLSNPFAAVYPIVVVILVGFILSSLFASVLVDAYNKEKRTKGDKSVVVERQIDGYMLTQRRIFRSLSIPLQRKYLQNNPVLIGTLDLGLMTNIVPVSALAEIKEVGNFMKMNVQAGTLQLSKAAGEVENVGRKMASGVTLVATGVTNVIPFSAGLSSSTRKSPSFSSDTPSPNATAEDTPGEAAVYDEIKPSSAHHPDASNEDHDHQTNDNNDEDTPPPPRPKREGGNGLQRESSPAQQHANSHFHNTNVKDGIEISNSPPNSSEWLASPLKSKSLFEVEGLFDHGFTTTEQSDQKTGGRGGGNEGVAPRDRSASPSHYLVTIPMFPTSPPDTPPPPRSWEECEGSHGNRNNDEGGEMSTRGEPSYDHNDVGGKGRRQGVAKYTISRPPPLALDENYESGRNPNGGDRRVHTHVTSNGNIENNSTLAGAESAASSSSPTNTTFSASPMLGAFASKTMEEIGAASRLLSGDNENLDRGRSRLRTFVRSPPFINAFHFVVLLNIVSLSWVTYPLSDQENAIQIGFDITFAVIFSLEFLLKVFAETIMGYFASNWNRLDFFVLAMSIAGVSVSNITGGGRSFALITSFRIIRLVRLADGTLNIRDLISKISKALASLGNVIIVIAAVFTTFSIIGVELFGRVQNGVYGVTNGFDKHNNFWNVNNGLMLLLRIMTGGNWPDLLNTAKQSHENSDCDTQLNGCGRAEPIPQLFFIIFLTISMHILKNLCVAVLVDAFTASGQLVAESKASTQQFCAAWLQCERDELEEKETDTKLISKKSATPSSLSSEVGDRDKEMKLALRPVQILRFLRMLSKDSVLGFNHLPGPKRVAMELTFFTRLQISDMKEEIGFASVVDVLCELSFHELSMTEAPLSRMFHYTEPPSTAARNARRQARADKRLANEQRRKTRILAGLPPDANGDITSAQEEAEELRRRETNVDEFGYNIEDNDDDDAMERYARNAAGVLIGGAVVAMRRRQRMRQQLVAERQRLMAEIAKEKEHRRRAELIRQLEEEGDI